MKEKRKAGKPDVLSIVQKRVTRKMPKKALEARIAAFLASRNMCVIATCAWDVPRATSLEYHSDGTTLYMMVEAAVIEFIDMSLKAEGYAAGQVWVR